MRETRMRNAHLSIMALAALGTFVAGTSAITAQPRSARAAAPLLALSDRDLSSTRESGCECTFRNGRATLARIIGNELTVRTRAGRQVCRLTETQFATLAEARGSVSCGGMRLGLRRTGRVTSHPESDSSDGPASLSLSQGRARRTLAGRWGCAC